MITHRESFSSFKALSAVCVSFPASASTLTIVDLRIEVRWTLAHRRFSRQLPCIWCTWSNRRRLVFADALTLSVVLNLQRLSAFASKLREETKILLAICVPIDIPASSSTSSHKSILLLAHFIGSRMEIFRGLWGDISSSSAEAARDKLNEINLRARCLLTHIFAGC